jgi:hypothetical protein
VRQLVIRCVDHEYGMDILESVYVSIEHKDVHDILYHGRDKHGDPNDDGQIAIVRFDSINDVTEFDETRIKYGYEMRLTVRKYSKFETTVDNALVDNLEITGTANFDSGETETITVTDTDII